MNRSFQNHFILCFSIVFNLLTGAPSLQGKNFFEQLLKGYQKYQEINTYLWLMGDTGAEKRFGGELRMFIMLTNKEQRDPAMNAWAKGIFSRLVKEAPDKGLPYTLTLLKGNTRNAFAIPGGHIFIYDGMLKFLESDDEVAAVLGHEIGHAVQRHALDALRRDSAFLFALDKLSKNGSKEELLGRVGAVFAHFQFSRSQELESDRLGFRWSKQSGFNPAATVYLWEKMKKGAKGKDGDIFGQFLSTHPTHQQRIDQAKRLLKETGEPETFNFKYSHFKKDHEKEKPSFDKFDGSFATDSDKDGRPDGIFFLTPGVSLDKTSGFPDKPSILFSENYQVYDEKVTSDFLPYKTGDELLLSGHLKGEFGTRSLSFGVEFYGPEKNLLETRFLVLSREKVIPTWKNYSGFFGGRRQKSSPPEATRFFRLVFLVHPGSREKIWLDNLSITPWKKELGIPMDISGHFDESSSGLPAGWKSSLNFTLDKDQFHRGKGSLRIDPIAPGVPTYIEGPGVPIEFQENLAIQFFYKSKKPLEITLKLLAVDEAGRLVTGSKPEKSVWKIQSNLVWSEERKIFNPTKLGYQGQGRVSFFVRLEAPLTMDNSFWIDEFSMSTSKEEIKIQDLDSQKSLRNSTKTKRR